METTQIKVLLTLFSNYIFIKFKISTFSCVAWFTILKQNIFESFIFQNKYLKFLPFNPTRLKFKIRLIGEHGILTKRVSFRR